MNESARSWAEVYRVRTCSNVRMKRRATIHSSREKRVVSARAAAESTRPARMESVPFTGFTKNGKGRTSCGWRGSSSAKGGVASGIRRCCASRLRYLWFAVIMAVGLGKGRPSSAATAEASREPG